MNMRHEELVEEVREWMRYAEADLRAAHHLTTMPDRADWTIAFHAQQSVEKSLKAYLVL